MRFLRTVIKAFSDLGWAFGPMGGLDDLGIAPPPCVPQALEVTPRDPDMDPLTVPLTAGERETFQQLIYTIAPRTRP